MLKTHHHVVKRQTLVPKFTKVILITDIYAFHLLFLYVRLISLFCVGEFEINTTLAMKMQINLRLRKMKQIKICN